MNDFIYIISWILIYFLPILLFIIGGVKFFVANGNLNKDNENCNYKKSLLVAKELLVNALFFGCAYAFNSIMKKYPMNGLAVEAVENVEQVRMKSNLIMYMMLYISIIFALICAYLIILCLIKKEIKETEDDSLYLEKLIKHKKIINKIYIIALIIYFFVFFIAFGKLKSIQVPIERIT